MSLERHGRFDVVLCSGILYHLDTPDVFAFIERIGEVCTRVAVFNTQVSTAPAIAVPHQGRTYHGRRFLEHLPSQDAAGKERATWASLDNAYSFWFTRPSLINMLVAAGFTSVVDCLAPARPGQRADWVTWLAYRGERQRVLSSPRADGMPEPLQPEHAPQLVHPGQRWFYPIARRVRPWLGDGPVRLLGRWFGTTWAREKNP